jgi:hypothetical protein
VAINSGVKIELSELLRIKSLVFVAQNDRESAISCLAEAIEVARTQSALAFELRSAIDLARLLSDGEQRDQGRHSLALVYERFSEGFQTADLKVARGLLENLQPDLKTRQARSIIPLPNAAIGLTFVPQFQRVSSRNGLIYNFLRHSTSQGRPIGASYWKCCQSRRSWI